MIVFQFALHIAAQQPFRPFALHIAAQQPFRPFALHIAAQQPFRPFRSRLRLHYHEPSRTSFALCFKSLLMSLLPTSGEFLLGFPSPRCLSSSGSLLISSLGAHTGSCGTTSLAVRVTGTHKPLHHWRVEIPMDEYHTYNLNCRNMLVLYSI
jgi:hypothetical protein